MKALNHYVLLRPLLRESPLILDAYAQEGRFEVVGLPAFGLPGVRVGSTVLIDTKGAAGARSSGLIVVQEAPDLVYAVDYRFLVAVLNESD